MTNDMPELKPCPFCGGKAELHLNDETKSSFSSRSAVKCTVCKLFCAETYGVDGGGKSPTDAMVLNSIQLWNTRADKAAESVQDVDVMAEQIYNSLGHNEGFAGTWQEMKDRFIGDDKPRNCWKSVYAECMKISNDLTSRYYMTDKNPDLSYPKQEPDAQCKNNGENLNNDTDNVNAGLLEALKAAQWDCHGKCPACSGWNMSEWGETAKVHTSECIVGKAIQRAEAGQKGGE